MTKSDIKMNLKATWPWIWNSFPDVNESGVTPANHYRQPDGNEKRRRLKKGEGFGVGRAARG